MVKLELEQDVNKWFIQNYTRLGFKKILTLPEARQQKIFGAGDGMGDYWGFKNDKWLRIELEVHSSTFFTHKKEVRDKIDVLICWKRSKSGLEKETELATKEVIELSKQI